MESIFLGLLLNIFVFILAPVNGCAIEGIQSWLVAETITILDTFKGNIWDRTTSNIAGISSITYTDGLKNGPYLSISLNDVKLVIATNNAFDNYEEYETANLMGFTISFRCTDGSSRNLVFQINITDTNNNDPQFRPSNTYEFSVAPPIPPGFLITNCANDITVRDIDLTTQKIDFEILSGSSLFEITYDSSSDVAKEFKAALRTTTLIRSIPEPITLIVKATDVDLTGDPRRTATATVKITTDTEFSFPDEPIFSQAFYLATYTGEPKVILQNSISLRQGFDEQVIFTFEGEYSQYFNIITNGNEVSFTIKSQLPIDLYREGQIFLVVKAHREYTSGATATVVIQLPTARELSFEKFIYKGTLEHNIVALETIVLNVGYDSDVIFKLKGDYADYFYLNFTNNEVSLYCKDQLPDNVLENGFIVLVLSASGTNAVAAATTILLEIIKKETITPVFSQFIYEGIYENTTYVEFEKISLIQGYDDTVSFDLDGENAKYFSINTDANRVMLTLKSAIPEDLIFHKKVLTFSVRAEKPRTFGANAAITLKFPQDLTEPAILRFSQNIYRGRLEDGVLNVDKIVLKSGFTAETIFSLSGESFESFTLSNNTNEISIKLSENVDLEDLKKYKYIVLEIEASRQRAISVICTLIIDLAEEDTYVTLPIFEKAFYTGSFAKESGLNFTDLIALQLGFDETVTFKLEGDNTQWFDILQNGNSVLLLSNEANSLPDEVFKANSHLLFIIVAQKSDTISGRATIFISLLKEVEDLVILRFERNSYVGSIQNGSLIITDNIQIVDMDISSVNLKLTGEYRSYFTMSQESGYLSINLLEMPEEVVKNNEFIILYLEASKTNAISAFTTIILNIVKTSEIQIIQLLFEQAYYIGEYSKQDGFLFSNVMRLKQGFDESVTFDLEGDDSKWFILEEEEQNSLILKVNDENGLGIVTKRNNLVFTIVANRSSKVGRSAIIITLKDSDNGTASVSFDNILYSGNLKGGVLSHETIRLTGFTGINIIISGEFAALFKASVTNGYVTIFVATSASFPENLTFIALTLRADSANAVLILDVTASVPDLPTVTFSSPSYFLWVDLKQDGSVGRVQAVVSNGELVEYSITSEDYLQTRISITTEGKILLLAYLDRGVYNFKVTGTAQKSRVSATVPVLLRVEGLPECSPKDGLPPLIVLERIEEEPHINLVAINQTSHKDCWYSIQSLWPEDQSWLYVNSEGLHAKAIDREHESIAFMVVSQIQVELILHCDNDDDKAIVKHSLTTETGSELNPYDYGFNRWILANTITYNARRSVVNLIVEDINDNAPVFVGKENEPIYVGYPIAELENTILPRALIILKATDADIGENAAIMYWSKEDNLAVAPNTGYVHVRNNALLENNSRHTVYATDQNGRGLNGSLDIVVKLLERNHIAVITVRNAFLDNIDAILNELSTSVGYNINILRTVVISDNNEESEMSSRRIREVANTYGASLLLFVYGMYENQVIDVDKIKRDLDKVVSVDNVQVVSLEDHLESLETCIVPGRIFVLLASTITLASLLFVLIISVAIWIFIKRRKENYEKFSDASSMVSHFEKEQETKIESLSKPRLDIEELKRSERRLQEMLNAPVSEITVRPPMSETKKVEKQESVVKPEDTLINVASQPIVIQSFDKLKDNADESEDDEFGEVETAAAPRKSVVTFNENVEKIIHLEDGIDDNSEPDTEVYSF